MKPLPSEVIAGVRRILKETIAPELTSDHARSRLDEIRAVLAQVDWDDAGFVLAARNRILADALGRIEEWRTADPAGRRAFRPLVVRVSQEDRLAAQQAVYQELAAAAVAIVDPLSDWLDVHPDDVEARAMHRALLAAL
jgi:hypothetical protein